MRPIPDPTERRMVARAHARAQKEQAVMGDLLQQLPHLPRRRLDDVAIAVHALCDYAVGRADDYETDLATAIHAGDFDAALALLAAV